MRSETWPSTPLDGDAWTPAAGAGARCCSGCTTAVVLEAALGVAVPPRRNAAAEGASLIGVPTVGVDGSPRMGVPWRGATSSTLMRSEGEGAPPKMCEAEGGTAFVSRPGDWKSGD